MATYLYCVRTETRTVPTGLAGLEGAPVRCIRAGSLAAWVSDVPELDIAATVDRVRAHDTVCAAALDEGDTPLPIRFGQTFAHDAATVDALMEREAALAKRLARVSGCVELRVVVRRGRPVDDAIESGVGSGATAASDATHDGALEGPGTAFLRRLANEGRADLAREVACEEVRHAVRSAAKPFIVEHQRCEAARGISYFPVLVRRADVAPFQAAVSATGLARTIDFSVLGPFAPYSFAGDA